jgi:hypothetical protein
MKTWGNGVIALAFLISALGVGELSASNSGRLTPAEEPPYPLDGRLGGSQNRYGRRGEETNFASVGNRTPAIQPIALPYTTELSRLL